MKKHQNQNNQKLEMKRILCTNVCSDRMLPGSLYLICMDTRTALMAQIFVFLKNFCSLKIITFLVSLGTKTMNLDAFHELSMLGTKIISENIEKLVFSIFFGPLEPV